MASSQSEAIKVLYKGWIDAMSANPEMGLDEMRDIFEHWGDITNEPGEVDYSEVDAGGVQAMWAVPKGCAEDRVVCLLYTSPSPRDLSTSRMPSSA